MAQRIECHAWYAQSPGIVEAPTTKHHMVAPCTSEKNPPTRKEQQQQQKY